MNRRAIGGSLLALAFGPVALGAIALGATAQLGPTAADSIARAEGAHLLAADRPVAQADASAAERGGEHAMAPARAAVPLATGASNAAVLDRAGGFDASRLILALAPKTSPPSA